ncbi:histidine phosphatase family protein [Nocardioides sp.]|uniref:histidine phosphatase family protein n=1 Tax=Nocardioides sp. TaxID=35761 RepID=UPI003529A183
MSDRRALILLRHGRTAWNAVGRAQGHADVPLDDLGRAQAEAAARALAPLGPVRLWSSDLARARETADRVAAATGLLVETTTAFREYSVGERTGLTLAEFAERHPREYAAWRAGHGGIPGAESDDEVLARFVPALAAAMADLGPGECGVVVTHGAALKAALAEVLGLGRPGREALGVLRNAHWVELVHSASSFLGGEARWRLAGYNLSAEDAPRDEPGPGAAAAGGDFVSDEPAR